MDARENRGGRRRGAGNRDLIIRMLAEVFRLRQSEEGPVRWEQVSSSLVPVSLYSRTTEIWLNRLTADLPIGQAASTMSPDSHRLLLLLHLSSFGQMTRTEDEENRVVFQVVAHDFCEGRFWTLLNAKINQPGTKLGHASDYFVYWKDTMNPSMHSSYSLASNQSSCCHLAQTPNRGGLRQTWGLNFASVNDAKLFYDICSLNPVNLSFNSAFLKKFSKSIGLANFDACLTRQTMLRNHTDPDLKYLLERQSNNNLSNSGSLGRRHHSSGIPSPGGKANTAYLDGRSEFVCHDERRINSCLAHLQDSELYRPSFRSRSCSTSRKKSNKQSLDRNMSYSTHKLSTHTGDSDYGSIKTRNFHRFMAQQQNGMHNSNCETLQREQDLLREHYHFHNYVCPEKPARGQFRDPLPADSLEKPSYAARKVKQPDTQNSGYLSDQAGLSKNNIEIVQSKPSTDDTKEDQQASMKFLESKSNQRRSTAVDSSSIHGFNASLARANYAKSKNLSLDAGGFQSTPTHLSLRNERNCKPIDVTAVDLDWEVFRKEDGPTVAPNNVKTSKLPEMPVKPERKMVSQARKESASNSERQFSSSIDYQLQIDALNVGVPYGFDTARCEASTTTDDLPLDPIVRKRMFQLSVAESEKENSSTCRPETKGHNLQKERLIRTNEPAGYSMNSESPRFEDAWRQSLERESCIDHDSFMQTSVPRPSFAAHLSDSSLASSPEAEAVAYAMRTKRRVRSKSTSNSHGSERSKAVPSAKQQDDYACCLDLIGKADPQKENVDTVSTNFKSVPNIADQPIYDYNFDLMNPQGSQQLCYTQKLSNTLSSVSDFEH